MFKQAWNFYVKIFMEHPEYCAKWYLAVCGAIGLATGVATYYHDKCKHLERIVLAKQFESDLWRTYAQVKEED